MSNFIKTIISAFKSWVSGEIKDASKASVADWNQNDVNADNYIKNRTHWEETSLATIVEEQTLTGFMEMQNGLYSVVDAFTIDPIVGQMYTVVWDGVSYELPMEDLDTFGYIGNTNYLNMIPEGDIPFAIIFAEGIFVVTTSNKTHTISISTKQNIVHKLDPKYFPDDIGSPSDWNQNDESGIGYIKNRTHYDCIGDLIHEGTSEYDSDGFYNAEDLTSAYDILYFVVDGISYAVTKNNDNTYGDRNFINFPFYLSYYSTDSWYAMSFNTSETHTYSIYKYDIHQLDEKYLPKTAITEKTFYNPKNGIIIKDEVNGYDYVVSMKNGILVSYCTTDYIYIDTMSNKTTYAEGETFNPDGMVVMAYCKDGTTREILNYTYEETVTNENVNHFIITYTECNNNVFTTSVGLNLHDFSLIDFNYTANNDGTYTLDSWKGTYNGEPSTRIVVPNNELIIV